MAMSSIMSNLGGFMGCSSSSFTTRVCRRRGHTSDGPQPPPNTLSPKTSRGDGPPGSPMLRTTLAPCLLSSRQSCSPFRGDGARGASPAPRPQSPAGRSEPQPVPSPGTRTVAEPGSRGPSRGAPRCHPTTRSTPPSCAPLRSLRPRSSTISRLERSLVIRASS